MNNMITMLSLLSVFLLTAETHAQQTGTLRFRITNLSSADGVAVVNLFRENDDIPSKPFMTMHAPIENGTAVVVFGNLPTGDYAAICYHDENNNGKLDHRLGFPNEPMGFSNHWNLSLFSGMPTFQKLKFTFALQQANVDIAFD